MVKEGINLKKIGKAFLSNNIGANILVLIALCIIFFVSNTAFLGAYNIRTMLTSIATLLIMASGATYVILIGSVDLSMGAVCSCGSVMLVTYIHYLGWAIYPAILLFGAFTGLILGFINTKFKIPSFIASLSMMSVYQSAALLICAASKRVASADKIYISWSKFKIFSIINPLIIIAVFVILILNYIQRNTTVGKSLNMIGANERAARLAGINVVGSKIFAFVICGVTSMLTGIVLALKLSSADAMVGSDYTLMAVASALLGGNRIGGGRGGLLMSLVGVIMVVVIQNGMRIIGVDAWWNNTVFGIVVIIAMILTTDRRSKQIVK